MNKQYIMAIDQGTTSSRVLIFNKKGKIVSKKQFEFKQIYPAPGWVEHDPEEIWDTVNKAIKGVLQESQVSIEQIAGIGITNQRETIVIWNKHTGEPVSNAIVWQCRRSTEICNTLKSNGMEKIFKQKTGLVLDPYFSGTKIKWLFDNIDGLKEEAEKGEILCGTIDSYLIWKLTNGKVHVTDYTNASRTLMYNINELRWDEELLQILDIPENILPEVKSSSEIYGYTTHKIFNGEKIPIAGIAGDQQAATFGQGCFENGMTKITYGTGAFMLMNTGKKVIESENGLLSTISWGLSGEIEYALEGSIFIAGAAVQWLRDEIGLIDDAIDTEFFANKVDDSDGIYFVPAFAGLGAPYWNPEARGMLVGLTRGTNRNHIIRATLESLVYRSYDVIKAMVEDSGIDLKDIKVDGGAAVNNFLLQFLADITGSRVERPVNLETTVTGAAYLAGLAVGFWQDKKDILSSREIDASFESKISIKERNKLYQGWQKAIETVNYWSQY